MLKVLLFSVTLLPQIALAQDAPSPPRSRVPTVENMKDPVEEPKFCLYEDKKFAKGSVKSMDGYKMICMPEDVVVFNSKQQLNLEWVSVDSYRGQLYLKPVSAPKR